jgi:uncharacterized membrane protein
MSSKTINLDKNHEAILQAIVPIIVPKSKHKNKSKKALGGVFCVLLVSHLVSL